MPPREIRFTSGDTRVPVQQTKVRMVETIYHVTAVREGRWWALRCEELPGVFSQSARLDQVADVVREAIAYAADAPLDSFEIEVAPSLPESYAEELRAANDQREAARLATSAAAAHSRAAARILADSGLTVRDIGTVMGISHQRAAQLLAP